MATPFTMATQPPPTDPRQAALQEGIAERQPPGAAPPAPGGNQVAMFLAEAAQALIQSGPTPENLAAIQQFLDFLQQLAPQGGAAQPAPNQAPVGPPQGAPIGPPAGAPPGPFG